MRILHTSDWHLGRSFHGASLLDDQAAVVDRVVSIVSSEGVDLVVIAGDLYDRAIPPGPAVELFDDAIARLHATGARVVAISGNHDSAVRVGGHDALLNRLGVAVRGDVTRLDEPIVIEDPADGGPPVAVYLVPYLEPAACAHLLGAAGDSEEAADDEAGAETPTLFDQDLPRRRRPTHDDVTRAATARIRRHLESLGGARSVVVAHAFVAGGAVSDSERDLSVGNVERVSVGAFDGFDLVALGHLHGPQTLAGDRIAYSGSPLPYSFSEERQAKSVRLVDLAVDGSVVASTIPLDVGRPLRTLTGTLHDLLTSPDLHDATEARVRVRLTDAHLPDQAMARIRARFPHAVELRHVPHGVEAGPGGPITEAGAIDALDPLELALLFWADQQGTEATEAERELLERALAASVLESGS